MKALTLLQPWASLMAIGAKRFETRSWSTPYRGPLLITASKGFPEDCKRLAYKNDPFSTVLHAGGFTTIGHLIAVCGHALCVVDLVDCVRVRGECPSSGAEHEASFGNYEAGRFAWRTENLRRLRAPIPVKGSLGVWAVPDDLQRQIGDAL